MLTPASTAAILTRSYDLVSRVLFQQIKEGRFSLVVSPAVTDELAEAPAQVQSLYYEFVPAAEALDITEEVRRLQKAFLRAGVVTERRETDALHVTLATVARCDCLVSWNFRHIVHRDRVSGYNAVSLALGYTPVQIFSPPEVIGYEKDNELRLR
jgi:predicted nucleic acid-binding protein